MIIFVREQMSGELKRGGLPRYSMVVIRGSRWQKTFHKLFETFCKFGEANKEDPALFMQKPELFNKVYLNVIIVEFLKFYMPWQYH